MINEIDFTADILDSRDIIARIEELRDEHDALIIEAGELRDDYIDTLADDEDAADKIDELRDAVNTAENTLQEWRAEFGDELAALESFASEMQGYGDWEHGEALIADSYFVEYAQDLAEDMGMERDQPWPYYCIDWEQAARDLKMDYTSGDLDGNTFWMRA